MRDGDLNPIQLSMKLRKFAFDQNRTIDDANRSRTALGTKRNTVQIGNRLGAEYENMSDYAKI